MFTFSHSLARSACHWTKSVTKLLFNKVWIHRSQQNDRRRNNTHSPSCVKKCKSLEIPKHVTNTPCSMSLTLDVKQKPQRYYFFYAWIHRWMIYCTDGQLFVLKKKVDAFNAKGKSPIQQLRIMFESTQLHVSCRIIFIYIWYFNDFSKCCQTDENGNYFLATFPLIWCVKISLWGFFVVIGENWPKVQLTFVCH